MAQNIVEVYGVGAAVGVFKVSRLQQKVSDQIPLLGSYIVVSPDSLSVSFIAVFFVEISCDCFLHENRCEQVVS